MDKERITNEDRLLSKCHQWLWNNFPQTRGAAWHVANERKTTGMQGAILKAKGVVAGVPDYVFNYEGKTYYIEFKFAAGLLSSSQKKVILALNKQGFEVYIIRSFEDFKELIFSIL